MTRERSRQAEPIRITSAGASRDVDISTRQRRYLLSMALRTVCFLGAIWASVAGLHWLWPFLMVGAVVLPYVAVVLANATGTRSDGFELVDVGAGRRELGAGETR